MYLMARGRQKDLLKFRVIIKTFQIQSKKSTPLSYGIEIPKHICLLAASTIDLIPKVVRSTLVIHVTPNMHGKFLQSLIQSLFGEME